MSTSILIDDLTIDSQGVKGEVVDNVVAAGVGLIAICRDSPSPRTTHSRQKLAKGWAASTMPSRKLEAWVSATARESLSTKGNVQQPKGGTGDHQTQAHEDHQQGDPQKSV